MIKGTVYKTSFCSITLYIVHFETSGVITKSKISNMKTPSFWTFLVFLLTKLLMILAQSRIMLLEHKYPPIFDFLLNKEITF